MTKATMIKILEIPEIIVGVNADLFVYTKDINNGTEKKQDDRVLYSFNASDASGSIISSKGDIERVLGKGAIYFGILIRPEYYDTHKDNIISSLKAAGVNIKYQRHLLSQG